MPAHFLCLFHSQHNLQINKRICQLFGLLTSHPLQPLMTKGGELHSNAKVHLPFLKHFPGPVQSQSLSLETCSVEEGKHLFQVLCCLWIKDGQEALHKLQVLLGTSYKNHHCRKFLSSKAISVISHFAFSNILTAYTKLLNKEAWASIIRMLRSPVGWQQSPVRPPSSGAVAPQSTEHGGKIFS